MVYLLTRISFYIFFKLFLGLRVAGSENIPVKGAFIIVANHASYLDPMLLISTIRRRLYFIARKQLFNFTFLGWVIRNVGTIPLKRSGRDMQALKKALEILKRNESLVIFPEGTRSKNKQLKKPRPGVGMLVARSKVPVIPVYIGGTFDAMPRGVKTLKRHKVTVQIGAPVEYESLFNSYRNKDRYHRIAEDIMMKMSELEKI